MATGSTGAGTPVGCVPEQALGAAGGADDRLLGRMLVEDFSNDRVLERLLLYERRIENSLYRTMRELREHKRRRLAGAPVEMVARLSARGSRGTGSPSASLLGQALPVSWDHGQDAHATRIQKSLRKTNPISGGAGGGQGLGGTGVGDDWSRNELCETNPISRGGPSSLPAVRRVA